MGEITYAWAPITKAERQEDGSVIVTGPMSDAGLDRDGQGMNQAWLDKVAPKWFEESGNIREQHDRFKAAGVGIGLHRQADGTFVLQSRIVDPVAALKCLPGPNGERPVYQGYSIGIREPRISFEKSQFPGGEVVGGYICETSLADRPSNPRMLFTMVKSDGPDDLPYPVGEELEPDPTVETETGEDITKAVKPGQRFRHGWIPIGGGTGDLPGDSSHSMRVGDVAATHHEGKTVIGHVAGFTGDNGSHVSIKHEGGTISVPRENVSHLHVAEPPKAIDQGVGEIKGEPRVLPGTDPGGAAKELAPEARQAAHLREQHAETEALGRSALGEGMFAAAIRQAEAAAARRAAAGPSPSAPKTTHPSKVKGAVKGAAGWMAAELRGDHDVHKAEVPDLLKFVSAKRRAKYAESGVAMPNGDFPIPDQAHLTAALRLVGRYKGDQAAARAHIKKRAAALGVNVDLDGPDTAEKLAALADLEKAARLLAADLIKNDGAEAPTDTDEVEAMDKTELTAMIGAAVTDALKGPLERMGEQYAALVGRVEKVEAAPVPGGPAISRAPGQTQQAKNREVAAVQDRIADLDRQADLYKSEDPTLSKGYREMADDLRAQITRS